MDGVFNVQIVRESLLKELSGLSAVLAEGGGLPAVEGARCLDLEDLRALLLVVASHDHADAEGAHTA